MGKPTGFIDYEREDAKAIEPKERIKNFKEFHIPLSMEKQQIQGARCMNCGVPFCQSGMTIMGMTSGCPLHNLVPEWNDLVYTGNWEQAYNRLKKTNNSPRRITSRNLHHVSARHSVRRPAPAVTGKIRSPVRQTSTALLKMLMKRDMQQQNRRECVPERKLQSSVPVLQDLPQQIS